MNQPFILLPLILMASCTPIDGNSSESPESVQTLEPEKLGVRPVSIPFGTLSVPDLKVPQVEALVGGKLSFENGCLYLNSGPRRYLPIFPAEHTRWDSDKNMITILGHELAIGQYFETNGGYYDRSRMTASHLINAIPETCSGNEAVLVGTQSWTRR